MLWVHRTLNGFLPVEYVMLQHEEDIKKHRNQSEAKFRGIAKDGGPII